MIATQGLQVTTGFDSCITRLFVPQAVEWLKVLAMYCTPVSLQMLFNKLLLVSPFALKPEGSYCTTICVGNVTLAQNIWNLHAMVFKVLFRFQLFSWAQLRSEFFDENAALLGKRLRMNYSKVCPWLWTIVFHLLREVEYNHRKYVHLLRLSTNQAILRWSLFSGTVD